MRNFAYEKFREPAITPLDESTDITDEYEISFVDEIMNKDLIEKVTREIQKMHPIEQELITLRIWEGMQFTQIAQIQEITENAAKKRFYRTISKLRTTLESKNIRSLIGLPSLFTALLFAGTSTAYAAPQALASQSGFSTLAITTLTIMTPIKTIFSSKLMLAGVAGGITTLSILGGSVFFYSQNTTKDETRHETKSASTVLENLPTITLAPTTTTILPVTQTPTPSPTRTAQPTPVQKEQVKKTTSTQNQQTSPQKTTTQTTPPLVTKTFPISTIHTYTKFSTQIPSDWEMIESNRTSGYEPCHVFSIQSKDNKNKIMMAIGGCRMGSTATPEPLGKYEVIKKDTYKSPDGKNLYLIRSSDGENTYKYQTVFVQPGQTIEQGERRSTYFLMDPKANMPLQVRISVIDSSPESLKTIDAIVQSMHAEILKN